MPTNYEKFATTVRAFAKNIRGQELDLMQYLYEHEHDVAAWYPNDFYTSCYTTLIRKLDCCPAHKYTRFKQACQTLGLEAVTQVGYLQHAPRTFQAAPRQRKEYLYLGIGMTLV